MCNIESDKLNMAGPDFKTMADKGFPPGKAYINNGFVILSPFFDYHTLIIGAVFHTDHIAGLNAVGCMLNAQPRQFFSTGIIITGIAVLVVNIVIKDKSIIINLRDWLRYRKSGTDV
jgi:hypothetical protein